jgi:hypothetical protein
MTLHTILSYIKSGIRVLGFIALGARLHVTAGFLLILAEVVGIFEELPGSYVGTETNSPVLSGKDAEEFIRQTRAVSEAHQDCKRTNSRGPM